MRPILVFDFVLTCRHYGIRFGQPPVEKAPSWSWISITVVMATAIDSTGVRADEENRENDRENESGRGTRRHKGIREGRRKREDPGERNETRRKEGGRRGRGGGGEMDRTGLERSPAERSTEGMVLLWWCYTVLALSDTMQAK